MATSLIAGIPVVKDIINTGLKEMAGLKVYDDALPVIGELDQIVAAIVKLSKGQGDKMKNIQDATTLIMEMAGVPAANAVKLWNATVTGMKQQERLSLTGQMQP